MELSINIKNAYNQRFKPTVLGQAQDRLIRFVNKQLKINFGVCLPQRRYTQLTNDKKKLEFIMKFNHLGIPTTEKFEGEIDIPHLKITVSDHENNPYRIQWMRFWPDAPYPELVKTIPHAAFEVDDLIKELEGKKVIIKPNSPSEGLTVAFVEVNGAPVELMEYRKS